MPVVTSSVRRILLAVCGQSPQIITETLYALLKEKQFIPTEIQVLATEKGQRLIQEKLLDPSAGAFHTLLKDLSAPAIKFDASCIRVLKTRNGTPINDLRTAEELTGAGDCILNVIRSYTNQPDCELHVSMSGGRKTMGFYAGYAMTLFGRPCDSMSHILIDADFEFIPDFFYPEQPQKTLNGRNGVTLQAKNCGVYLTSVPFLRLRSKLDERLLTDTMSLAAVIHAAQPAMDVPKLQILIEKKEIICDGVPIKLRPAELAIYRWLADRRLEHLPPADPNDDENARTFIEAYAGIIHKGRNVPDEKASPKVKALRKDFENQQFRFQDYLLQQSSRISALIREQLGEQGVCRFGIQASGRRPKTCYHIPVAPKDILIKERETHQRKRAGEFDADALGLLEG